MENKEELKVLIEGCKKNDRRSQEALFKKYYGKMLGVCLRYTKDRDTAEDVLQDGFIKVFDKLEKYDFKGSFEGWLRRIFSNTSIDRIRKTKKDPMLSDKDEDFKLGSFDPVEQEEAEQLTSLKGSIAIQAIQKLSPAYQTVFNLYVMEEYTHKEIAEILNISEGTSKSNLSKAKLNLQKILNTKFANID